LLLGVSGANNRTVSPGGEFALAILLPTAAVYAVIGGFRGLRWLSENVRTWQHRGDPPAESLERLTANLRRLRVQLEDTETRSDLTAKRVRLTALRAAYLDALRAACLRLDVPPPPAIGRVPQAEIYRVEAALRERGLDVREPVAG
jgi:hypothetical protein